MAKQTKKEAAAKKAAKNEVTFRAAYRTLHAAEENSPEYKQAEAYILKSLSKSC
jgi:hypothetical protein